MPSDTVERIPLTRIPRELASLTGQTPPTYRKLYLMILDGRLPEVEPNESGRYDAPRASLPRIAEAVGLTAATSADLACRQAASPSSAAAVAA